MANEPGSMTVFSSTAFRERRREYEDISKSFSGSPEETSYIRIGALRWRSAGGLPGPLAPAVESRP